MLWKLRKDSDAEIVRRVLAGKRDDFGVLVERYLAVVQAVAYSRTGNRADAQDIAQDTFLTAFEKLDTVRDAASIGAWLTTIARHRAVRLMQQRQRRAELQERNLSQEPEAHMPSPEKAEIRELLRQEVLRLDEDYREALMLHYFAGKKVREVADLLDITIDAAKKRLQRAREALSASLATQLSELLEADEPREKQVSRIMGVVAMSTPSWQGASLAMAGGTAAASGALALKVISGAAVALVAGGVIWNWAAPNSENDGDPIVARQTDSNGSTRVEEDMPKSSPAEGVPDGEESPEISRSSILANGSNAASTFTQAITAASGAGLSVSGRVVDPDGTPVPVAEVVLHVDDPYTHEKVEAGPSGEFVFKGLPQAHAVYVQATSPEDEPVRFESDVAGPFELQDASRSTLTLTLDRPRDRRLAGTIVDTNGAPIEDVGVLAAPQNRRQFGNNVRTDAQGRFSVPGLAAGNYKIGLSLPGQYSWRVEGKSPVYTIYEDRDLQDIIVRFDDYGTLAIGGRVMDINGTPISDARIEARGAKGSREAPSKSDMYGRYSISGLPAGDDYSVTAYHPDFTTREIWDISAGQLDADIVMEPRGAIEGTVVDAQTGLPIRTFQIGHSAEIPSAGGALYLGTQWEPFQDDEGSFRITGLHALRTSLSAKAPGYSLDQIYVEVPSGSTKTGIVLRLQASLAINGIVVDGEDSPIAGAMMFYGGLPHQSDRERTAAARTPEDGRFTLDTFPEYATGFTVYHPDYAPSTVPLAENNVDSYRVVLEKGGSLTGQLSIAGAPPGSSYLTLGYTSLGYPLNVDTQASASGEYAFPHLPEGDVRLDVTMYSAEDPETKRAVTRIVRVESAGVTIVDIDLAELTASLEGIITLNGVPVADAWIALEVGPDGEAEYFRTQTGLDGAYLIEQVPGGAMNVIVQYEAEGATYHRQTDIVVPPNALSRWDVDLTDSDVLSVP